MKRLPLMTVTSALVILSCLFFLCLFLSRVPTCHMSEWASGCPAGVCFTLAKHGHFLVCQSIAHRPGCRFLFVSLILLSGSAFWRVQWRNDVDPPHAVVNERRCLWMKLRAVGACSDVDNDVTAPRRYQWVMNLWMKLKSGFCKINQW